MKRMNAITAGILSGALLLGLLAGCGSAETSSASSSEVSAPEETAEAVSAAAEETAAAVSEEPAEAETSAVEDSTLESPVEEPAEKTGPVAGDKDFDWSVFEPLTDDAVTLTMFYTQPPMLAAIEDSPNDMSLLYQRFEEMTNVHIDFQMVNMMDATSNFTLMIASGDYCDIVNDALNYYDTADQAYEDGIAVDLLEHAEDVPNFLALMDKYSEIRSDLLTLDGHILNMPRIDVPIEEQQAAGGFLIRKDWLDDLGLDIPQSYDAMHAVLAEFKNAYGVTDPYIMPYQVLSPWGVMAGGYGITATAGANNFYVDLETDRVELSTASDAYYEYLSMFRDWYDEGLLNPNFTSQTMNLPDESIISNEQAGIWFSDQGYIKTYADLLTSVNPDAELALMSDPGRDDAKSGYIQNIQTIAGTGGFSVSENATDVDLALQWCDMWYNPDLTQFINYGYEGETFEYDEDGNPVLGGIIVNNDLGLPSLQMANGVYLCTSGGFIYEKHKYDIQYTPLQIEAYTAWTVQAEDPDTVTTSNIPAGAKMNVDEATAVSNAMADITTYVAEMALKFVTGVEPLDEESYAAYVANIEGMNLETALDAQQAAYDRYLENKG